MSRVGTHLIVDIWGSQMLSDKQYLTQTFRLMADAGKAKVLDIILHDFPAYGGLTGVAVLAESHISVHTWPELDYAAFDIFMCGNCTPHDSVAVLIDRTKPKRISVRDFERGIG